MDEADVRQKARTFVAKVDASDIRQDLTPYVVEANAKVKKEELSEGSPATRSPSRTASTSLR